MVELDGNNNRVAAKGPDLLTFCFNLKNDFSGIRRYRFEYITIDFPVCYRMD